MSTGRHSRVTIGWGGKCQGGTNTSSPCLSERSTTMPSLSTASLQKSIERQGRLEASFSSKLVATIRPDKPIYDKYVRQNLSLAAPAGHLPPEIRIWKFLDLNFSIEAKTNTLVQHASFQELRDAFDDKFSSYAHVTDIKKLDLFLWQHRQRPRSEVRGKTIIGRRDAHGVSPDTRRPCVRWLPRKCL